MSHKNHLYQTNTKATGTLRATQQALHNGVKGNEFIGGDQPTCIQMDYRVGSAEVCGDEVKS